MGTGERDVKQMGRPAKRLQYTFTWRAGTSPAFWAGSSQAAGSIDDDDDPGLSAVTLTPTATHATGPTPASLPMPSRQLPRLARRAPPPVVNQPHAGADLGVQYSRAAAAHPRGWRPRPALYPMATTRSAAHIAAAAPSVSHPSDSDPPVLLPAEAAASQVSSRSLPHLLELCYHGR